MKTFLTIAILAGAISFAQAQSEAVPNRGYTRYSTGVPATSPKNSPFRKWATAQLQQRRIELYRTVTRHETRQGAPVYHYHQGDTSPQQDEIFAIEGELNRRYQAGDKDAELKRPIPGMQHPG
ncbi:MAG: hypothetical protein QOG48_1972 [Verrucomicrobiota bacterium]|jgi:hypothetical protein